ncbi:MAG: hypothetical protein COV67_03605 [Nitrospinae bacterium CG11_big_fil_rev_8_21_14_0_20_56_8]|nr:MAG: hypothetical protein COV67_03605 [Nitrospinae bacterium CG11_big_fil_rev_8_21_14_0_20_56_8]
MSDAIAALKDAIEFEKKALEKYKEALSQIEHKETRDAIEKMAQDKNQQIDSLHWMVMAESGALEPEETAQEEKPKTSAGKCPFSGQFAAMGLDMSKMGDMMGDPSKMAEMMEKMKGNSGS